MKHILIVVLLVFCAHVKAEWFEVVGYGGIVDGDASSARQMAVKDAITQALIFSGATTHEPNPVTSFPSRSSITISSPISVLKSIVEYGQAT